LTGDPDGEVEFRAKAGIAGPLVDLRIVDSDMNSVPHEAAVIGVKDDKWGERPLALVKRAPDANGLSDAVIKDHLKAFADKGSISKYGIPHKVFIDSIPRTSVGKVNKKELRERYADV
jgi:acyl-CoA synthetase (AMP-forming)/AMP-acid ligase II